MVYENKRDGGRKATDPAVSSSIKPSMAMYKFRFKDGLPHLFILFTNLSTGKPTTNLKILLDGRPLEPVPLPFLSRHSGVQPEHLSTLSRIHAPPRGS